MVERGENKYSKESSYSCKKYEIAKEWRGNDLSAEDISACSVFPHSQGDA